jgi:hypothetical protein
MRWRDTEVWIEGTAIAGPESRYAIVQMEKSYRGKGVQGRSKTTFQRCVCDTPSRKSHRR